jgi:hypothetical protein
MARAGSLLGNQGSQATDLSLAATGAWIETGWLATIGAT